MMGAAAALWGASYLFIKVALDDVSEGGIVCIRTALGAAVLLTLAHRWGALDALRGHGRWIVVIALVHVVAPFLLITFGENHIDSQLAGILVSSAPIFTALLALRFDRAGRMTGWGASGRRWSSSAGPRGTRIARGPGLAVGDPARHVHGVERRRAGATWPSRLSSRFRCFLATLPDQAPSAKAVGSLVVLGAGGTGIAFLWFYTLIRDLGPARAAVVAYIAPGLLGALRHDAARRAAHRRSDRRSRAHPRRLVAGGTGPARPARPPARPPARLSRSAPSRSSAPAPARAR